jgi:hypothetical protein
MKHSLQKEISKNSCRKRYLKILNNQYSVLYFIITSFSEDLPVAEFFNPDFEECPNLSSIKISSIVCPTDRPWGPPSLLYNGYLVFPGGKEWPGCDDPSPPSSAVVKKG